MAGPQDKGMGTTMPEDGSILNRIHEGMTVYDSTGEVIGTVETVYLGNVSDEAIVQGGREAESPDIDLGGNDSLVESVARVFGTDELPRELAERLLKSGYIRLDMDGLFAADRYVMPEQISSVLANGVRLRVSRDELMKRG